MLSSPSAPPPSRLPSVSHPRRPNLTALSIALTLSAAPLPALAANESVLRSLEQYKESTSTIRRPEAFKGLLPSPDIAITENAKQYQSYKEEGQRSRPVQSFSSLGFTPLENPLPPGPRAPPASLGPGPGLSPPSSRSNNPFPSRDAPSTAPARPSIKEQLAEGRRLEGLAHEQEAAGNYQEAVRIYTELLERCPDLVVLGQEARFDRALALYEAGSAAASEVVLDELRALKELNSGDPDLLVAYAAVLYSERPSRVPTAELLLEKATALQPKWNVIAAPPRKALAETLTSRVRGPGPAFEYLRENGWPPRMNAAVEKFLSLK